MTYIPAVAPALTHVPSLRQPLQLSASSVNRWLTCPRQYFYENRLRVQRPLETGPDFGNWVHQVFAEWMHRYSLAPDPISHFAPPALLAVGMEALHTPTDAWAYSPWGIVQRQTPLTLLDWQTQWQACVRDLTTQGFFARRPLCMLPEYGISLELTPPDTLLPALQHAFAALSISGVRVTGRIDALWAFDTPQGIVWWVLDLKTSAATHTSQKSETRQAHLAAALEPLPVLPPSDNDALPVLDRAALQTGSALALRQYQLPFYALAVWQDARLQAAMASAIDKVLPKITPSPLTPPVLETLALQYVRTPADSKGIGSIQVALPVERLQQALPGLLADLWQHVVLPIAQADATSQTLSAFPVMPGKACDLCVFALACEGPSLATEDTLVEDAADD